jgi:hypothetical protein
MVPFPPGLVGVDDPPPPPTVLQGRNSTLDERSRKQEMKSTKQTEANAIEQKEALRQEINELDIQLERLKERRTALSQAMVLAAREEEGGEERPAGELEEFENPEVMSLNTLQWRPFGPGKKGEWAFATERDGGLVKQLEQSPSVISALKTHQRLDRGGYHYKMSRDGRFLHRFPADASE